MCIGSTNSQGYLYFYYNTGGMPYEIFKAVWNYCIDFIAGRNIKRVDSFPIPGSVYGLVILLICLMTGILKVSDIRETAAFLIEIMPVMFVPAAVGLLDSSAQLAPVFIPVIVIVVCSTIL